MIVFHQTNHRSKRGLGRGLGGRAFTLVEVLVTIVVIAAVGSVASLTLTSALDGYIDAATQAQLHTELSIAVDRIDRELRRTGLKSASPIAPNISSVSATSIAWNNNYSLSLAGGNVMLVENGAAAAILQGNVMAFSVQTYNESNTALAATLSGAACDPIRRVRVSITIQRAGMSETLRTKVYLRSTMEGA